jgi:hypothetical protein
MFCSRSLAIMRRVPFARDVMIARFFGKLAALLAAGGSEPPSG